LIGREIDPALLPESMRGLYEVWDYRGAFSTISTGDPTAWGDIVAALSGFRIARSQVVVGGGNESLITKAITEPFMVRGWTKAGFSATYTVKRTLRTRPQPTTDEWDVQTISPEVDLYRGNVAVEIEWNNEAPFFARDLDLFRVLFELRAIRAGVIITRGHALQALLRGVVRKGWEQRRAEGHTGPFRQKYGTSTTHMEKLLPLLESGAGGGCPVLAIGIGSGVYDPQR